MGFSLAGASVDGDVIHVDSHASPINEVSEDGVHHGLEGGQRVGEPEKHHVGSKSPSFVMKATFHLSFFLIRTSLYPHSTSNPVNRVAPLS